MFIRPFRVFRPLCHTIRPLSYRLRQLLSTRRISLFRTMSSITPENVKVPPVKLPKSLEAIRPQTVPQLDYSTNSNYTCFEVKETYLDFEIVFKDKILDGFVEYQLKVLKATSEIVLDLTTVNVSDVILNNAANTSYYIEADTSKLKNSLGKALIVTSETAFKKDDTVTLKIQFTTSPESTALQFLSKELTDGKQKEYLFSQSEPIHARSIYPCFDTPSIKSPFRVRVKSPLKTLVSALPDLATQEKETDSSIYHFVQPVPIPSYLFAIVSGDITSAKIGPRSLVYTEPVNIERCANEFEGEVVEKFLKVLEDLIFKYEWTTYDFVVAPMAFPYGGMENPQLTLANSTVVSGDRENIDVIAHELAHSYSGNLVTVSDFATFWLNEGWTVYLERRILAALHGESYRHFSAIIGWKDLEESVSRIDGKFTKLVLDLSDGSDPDDAFSTVPYEKGFNFLFHLETVVGGTQKFDPFIRYYFTKYNKKSLDTFQFIETLFEFYYTFDENLYKKLLDVDYETWLLKPGMPPKPDFDTTLANQCIKLSETWFNHIEEANKNGKTLTAEDLAQKFSNADVESFSSNQIVVFLDNLSSLHSENKSFLSTTNGQAALKFFQDSYTRISHNNNAEVKFRLFKLLLLGKVQSSYTVFADWLGTVGRMKFVRPGYILLNDVDRDLAVSTFEKNKNSYHPICVAMVKKDINL